MAAMPCGHASHVEGCPDCELAAPTQVRAQGHPTRDMPTAGTRVGRYVVLERIGQGGMGMVFAARDPRLDRRVAIKLLLSADETDVGASQLLREAQAMAKLSHPNVLPVFDVGTFDGGVFIAMELVEGSTLREWLRAERRGWRRIVSVFIAAARGLRAAHQAGLVHGDFKPDNILIDGKGRVRVSDFGLASPLEKGSAPMSAPAAPGSEGPVSGTPGYTAPELHEGRAPSRSTDQFAFCVSLYEALHGRRPSAADVDALGAPGALSRHPVASREEVPQWLDRAVLRGASVEPGSRFAGMHTLIRALRGEERRRQGAAPRRMHRRRGGIARRD